MNREIAAMTFRWRTAASNSLPLMLLAFLVLSISQPSLAQGSGNLETQVERFVPQDNLEERINKSRAERLKRQELERQKWQKQKKDDVKAQ